MDQERYMTQMASSFLEELGEIEKQAGVMSTLAAIPGMLTRGGRLMRNVASQAQSQGLGGMLRQRGRSIQRLYQRGAQAVGKSGDPAGWLGGFRNVLGSRYGALAGTLGLGGLAAYGGGKMLFGGPSYPPGY